MARKQCIALRKVNGLQCSKWAIEGRDTCAFHGGMIDQGIAVATYKTGEYVSSEAMQALEKRRYSLQGKLKTGYEQMLAEKTEMLNAADEIALLLARVQIIAGALEELPVVSGEVFRYYERFLQARASGNVTELQKAFGQLDVAMEEAKSTWRTTQELLPTLDVLRKTRETEMKRRMAMRQSLTIEDARKFFQTIQGIVLECTTFIADDEERRKVKLHFANRVRQAFADPAHAYPADLERVHRTP